MTLSDALGIAVIAALVCWRVWMWWHDEKRNEGEF